VTPADNPICLALDYSELDEARDLLSKIRQNIGMIKIGSELFTAHGREALELSKEFAVPVFLDLKLNDIPTTVEKTTEVVCRLLSKYSGQHYLSVHCMGGANMCQAAFNVARGSNVRITGTTVLTSLSERDFRDFGFRDSRPGIRTINLALVGADCLNNQMAYNATKQRVFLGLNSFVCAPNQLSLMRQNLGDDVVLMTPGIRSTNDDNQDHLRTKPIGFALKNGANWVVIGRPITKSADPVSASLHFKEQAERAF